MVAVNQHLEIKGQERVEGLKGESMMRRHIGQGRKEGEDSLSVRKIQRQTQQKSSKL